MSIEKPGFSLILYWFSLLASKENQYKINENPGFSIDTVWKSKKFDEKWKLRKKSQYSSYVKFPQESISDVFRTIWALPWAVENYSLFFDGFDLGPRESVSHLVKWPDWGSVFCILFWPTQRPGTKSCTKAYISWYRKSTRVAHTYSTYKPA